MKDWMPPHIVQQGDCLSSLAEQYGLKWETIWTHAANAGLAQKRRDPNVLFPGDEIVIPDKERHEEPSPTDQRHKFVKQQMTAKLKLRLLDDGKPRAGLHYTLLIDGVPKTGTTDGQGFLEHKIPGDARRGRLMVETRDAVETYELALGTLDPLETEEGLRGRLLNLGFGGDNLKEAITAFQESEKLPATGESDEATRSRLKARFGQ